MLVLADDGCCECQPGTGKYNETQNGGESHADLLHLFPREEVWSAASYSHTLRQVNYTAQTLHFARDRGLRAVLISPHQYFFNAKLNACPTLERVPGPSFPHPRI